ncbi:transposase [Nitrococcus mobilis]|uniref:Transposase n=1 Tax=Nitrococcus mobilis Nb-231 TaxID=314278 RepID=A4BMU3_9GAMM|nr:transposase [Nitrococcus mobilis Nb-231]
MIAIDSRYSHRIAISNARLLGIEDESAVFRYTDYTDGRRVKIMRLAGVEFVRRFLLHVLPKRFMRIRHYGFLANRCRDAKLARIGACLSRSAPSEEITSEACTNAANTAVVCPRPACHAGVLRTGPLLAPSQRESG